MFFKGLYVVVQALSLPLWWLIFAGINLTCDRSRNCWVISGHRGRIKADNASALFDFITNHTDQKIMWIQENASNNFEDDKNALIARRNSVKARIAIAFAPVIIYSHGEDDLDILMIMMRRLTGTRIYIGHGPNFVKRGSMHPDNMKHHNGLYQLFMTWLATDYDYMLCMSDEEKLFWDSNQPKRRSRHIPYGGAPRLDKLIVAAQSKPEKKIVWFPTFRDSTDLNQHLVKMVETICQSPILNKWLEDSGYKLSIGRHINSKFENSNLKQTSTKITTFEPEQLLQELSGSSCLITDYSSIMVDWLLFDRPAVFFPFDQERFNAERGLHLDYGDYVYGDVVRTAEQLITNLIDMRWQDPEYFSTRRRELRSRFLPAETEGFARTCYTTICTITGNEQKLAAYQSATFNGNKPNKSVDDARHS